MLQEREQQEGQTLGERIDAIEAEANRNLMIFSQFTARVLPMFASAPAICISIASQFAVVLFISCGIIL